MKPIVFPLMGILFLGSTTEHASYTTWAQLGSITDGKATVEEILYDPVLRCFPLEEARKYNCIITDFCMYHKADRSSVLHPDPMSQGRLSAEQQNVIRNSKPGEELYFEQSMLICPDCTWRKLPPFKIVICRH